MPVSASSPLGIRDFRLFLGGRFCANLAQQMLTVAIGYYLYDVTRDALVLGYAALAVFLPVALLTLPAGDMAARLGRRRVLGVARALHTVCAGLFLLLVLQKSSDTAYFYAALVLS